MYIENLLLTLDPLLLKKKLCVIYIALRASSSAGGVVNRVPVSIVKPERICFHSKPILVSVPAVVSMGSILDIKDGVPKAGFSISWVLGLRLCHAAAKFTQSGQYDSAEEKRQAIQWTLNRKFKFSRISYLLAKPSIFPPSPMLIYTGADWSCIGVHLPFTMSYATLDTRSCYNPWIIFQIIMEKKKTPNTVIWTKYYVVPKVQQNPNNESKLKFFQDSHRTRTVHGFSQ